jgi:tetratricopeptide (TPR) repeat protein
MQAGMEAHRQGRFDVAIAEFRKATETDPNLAEAFLNLGAELMQIRYNGTAIAPLKRALELRPDLDAAHLQLGYALLSLGYAAEAIPHLERVHAHRSDRDGTISGGGCQPQRRVGQTSHPATEAGKLPVSPPQTGS